MIYNISGSRCFVSIISHKRPNTVQAIESICGTATWFVGDGEAPEYRNAGAANVVESGGLCKSRNAALDTGFANCDFVIEISDDLKSIKKAVDKKNTKTVTFKDAVAELLLATEKTHSFLAGVAPTSNAFYYNPKKPIQTNGFIVGDMILVKKTDLRFDECMRLKEDYDYTLQHLKKYGIVSRVNFILAEFLHRTNKGGACSYRTSRLEQEMILRLKKKWPGMIKDNPRRKDEILLVS